MRAGLSEEAKALIERAREGLEPGSITDYHVHLVGLGAGGTGAHANERFFSWLHPIEHLRFKIYLDASRVDRLETADQDYVRRLVDLVEHGGHRGRYHLLAFDRAYRRDGSVDEDRTEFYTPNRYVLRTAREHPESFTAMGSVHPYRSDALDALEELSARGVRMIKWLPNAMSIDPSDPRIDPYYDKMKELGMVLFTHAGEEQAVDAEEAQKLGNPLLLRRPLDRGLRVVVAHCASLGQNVDLESDERALVDNFDLFLRLMGEPRYEGLIYGEISAVVQTNRLFKPLRELLERPELHARLVNGSDYPLPAINVLIQTWQLENGGYINSGERELLNEIYDYNPLLFDFVLKRTLHLPGQPTARFPPEVFAAKPALGATRSSSVASPPPLVDVD
jgi:predicted TIM-barrel fold metal-dependent hydrolase